MNPVPKKACWRRTSQGDDIPPFPPAVFLCLGRVYAPGGDKLRGTRRFFVPKREPDIARRRMTCSRGRFSNEPGRRNPRTSSVPEIGRAHVELQSLMRTSYAVFCLKKKKKNTKIDIR